MGKWLWSCARGQNKGSGDITTFNIGRTSSVWGRQKAGGEPVHRGGQRLGNGMVLIFRSHPWCLYARILHISNHWYVWYGIVRGSSLHKVLMLNHVLRKASRSSRHYMYMLSTHAQLDLPYSTRHTLAFQSGGTLFSVDPFVFVIQANTNSVSACVPNLAPADSPAEDKDCCTAGVWELIPEKVSW